MIEPTNSDTSQIDCGLWTKINATHLALPQTRMVPRPDDQLRMLSGRLRAPILLHEAQMSHRPATVVVPTGEIEIGHLHFLVNPLKLPRPSIGMAQPILGVLSQTGRQELRQFQPRQ